MRRETEIKMLRDNIQRFNGMMIVLTVNQMQLPDASVDFDLNQRRSDRGADCSKRQTVLCHQPEFYASRSRHRLRDDKNLRTSFGKSLADKVHVSCPITSKCSLSASHS